MSSDSSASLPHALARAWTVYYSHRSPAQRVANYEEAIKKLATFSTVEEFWSVYSRLKRPNDLEPVSDYHLFRAGVRPVWEDPANITGGKWMIRFKKGISGRFWEDMILGLIGEQFADPINGLVLSIRANEDILSVWHPASAADGAANLRIYDTIKRVLNLPDGALLEYKEHNESLRMASSFRNTDVFR
ncbi:hypothetical protein AMAG_10691 [Allomyces macrogynus ATCC 38327]|uniref:Uncharacterized protein n=1 Tax=Allomyces macrogynus (strain ATCC 38327) TaxID=578462 RepID=A0A0L0SRP9_ALLM3|nr:hypothetical protein AMAG_10691 [Allomyces macrogynus ATCC 38327]|eukprot:KNE65024.1 hypothetical protein AMAG_10691 [Allomyces macrogynus ATCC 38327]